MKKLLKYISPLAPDNSGAVSVLYELGGLVVICDAGGCAGNVCGFDEPRWEEFQKIKSRRSALFSAGLRDMDAILGRDDKLVQKLAKATEQIKAEFTAIIGTPVPAVIATDYRALKRMCERKTSLPCITVDTTGTNLYDKGEEKAYLELFKTFAVENFPSVKNKVGIIGATPLDISQTSADDLMSNLREQGFEPVCFGMGSGLEEVKRASECEKILVISPSGIKSAEYLKEKFGIPFETGFPYIPAHIVSEACGLKGKKVLIVHQQFAANALREKMRECMIHCASRFMMYPESMQEGDFHISDEEDFISRVCEGGYDVIIADISLKRSLRKFKGEFIDFPHFAVSGRLNK